MKSIVKEISSVKNNINEVEKILTNVNNDFRLPETEFKNLIIAVSEIVMNAIVHGNKLDEKKMVRVSVDFDDKQLKITIKDEGNGFDFDKKQDPTLDENIFKSSGRGLYIVKSLIENVEYINTGKGSKVIITINKKT